MYDYLIVGAGLLGQSLLTKQKREERNVWSLIREIMWPEIFIRRK